MQPCDTLVKHLLPWVFNGSFKIFKISTSEFGTVGVHRQMQVRRDEFLATVTEGVVHGVYVTVETPTQCYF